MLATRLPVVDMLPADVILLPAKTNPLKLALTALILPAVDTSPPAKTTPPKFALLALRLPVVDRSPPANTTPAKFALLAYRLPLALMLPVFRLPEVTFPVTLKLVSVPVLVIFGCAAVVNVPVR